MLNPTFLEIMNGIWAFLDLFMVIWSVKYLSESKNFRPLTMFWYNWPPETCLALGILIYHTGDFIVRGWVWWWRFQSNMHVDASWMLDFPALWVGSLIALVGILIKLRAFSYWKWGERFWILCAISSVASVLLVRYLF